MHCKRLAGVCFAIMTMVAGAPSAAQGREGQAAVGTGQQPAAHPNGVYLELLGSGGLYSINYEREIRESVWLRVGFGAWTATSFFSDTETAVTTVPITLTRLIGAGTHRLEVGGGLTLGRREREALSGDSGSFVSLTGLVGYRYQPRGRGFLFRASATPFYGFGNEDLAYPEKGFMPSLGISFGYVF